MCRLYLFFGTQLKFAFVIWDLQFGAILTDALRSHGFGFEVPWLMRIQVLHVVLHTFLLAKRQLCPRFSLCADCIHSLGPNYNLHL